MKKAKIISLTAAALLAVAPAVTNAMPVSAANNAQATTTANNSTSENPVITYNGKTYDSDQDISDIISGTSFGRVLQEDNINKYTNDLKAAFTATASSNDNTKLNVSVYTGDVNFNIAGKYPVKISAVNNAGKVTTLTFQIIVGSQGAGATYAVAQPQIKGNVGLFTIRDGKVIRNSYGSFVLHGGTIVATFGTVIIDGVSYTHLNSADSDIFVETKSVDGTYPESAITDNGQPKIVTKTLMHTALAYNADGHSTGKKYYAYRRLTLSVNTQNIQGSMYYLVQGTNDYVKVGNIDGTKRTLTHNAYIYATSTRRSSYTLLKKGTTITTYGSTYKFKNGKRYYRIEGATASNKRYVKAVNFE